MTLVRMGNGKGALVSRAKPDPYTDAMCSGTAAKLVALAQLRGVQATITWDGAQYVANGTPCGQSVHGVYEWLARQPGVKP